MAEGHSESLPSADECEARSQQFAAITGTDTALAMFYLQDRAWELEKALDAFYESQVSDQKTNNVKQQSSDTKSPDSKRVKLDDSEMRRIRLLSWNIDGLDQKNLTSRTHAVIDTIHKEKPDVVYLQELVGLSQDLIRERCPGYGMVTACDPDRDTAEQYFVGIMMNKATVKCKKDSVELVDFPNTVMMRNCLKLQARVKGALFTLMTSHLESTKKYSSQRIEQLKQCLGHVTTADDAHTVVFGGDLNIRDNEIAKLPAGVVDVWEATGSREEAKYTWDMMRNNNLVFNSKYKPRLRFDRLYLRHCVGERDVKPVYLELAGIEKVHSCGRFPSDHWGLLLHMDNVKYIKDQT